MTGIEFIILLIAWAIGGASPGPATLAIAGTSMQRGRGAGLVVAAGIVCGSASWGIAAALGVSALMLANAWTVELLRYLGAAYLLWLAFKSAKSACQQKPFAHVKAGGGDMSRLFLKGLLLHLTNPKPILGWGAMFAVVMPPGSEPAAIASTFLALISVSAVVFFGYAILFSTSGIVAGYQKLRRWFEGAFAALFGLAGFKVLTSQ